MVARPWLFLLCKNAPTTICIHLRDSRLLVEQSPVDCRYTFDEPDVFMNLILGEGTGRQQAEPSSTALLWRPIDGQTNRRKSHTNPCKLQGFAGFARR